MFSVPTRETSSAKQRRTEPESETPTHPSQPPWVQVSADSYLRAVEGHSGEDGLRDAGPLQLVADLLVDVGRDLHGSRVGPRVTGLAGPGDGRVVEELLVESLGVLVGQQATDGQLLVDEVRHGQLLPHQLGGELGREQPPRGQQGLEGGRGGHLGAERGAVVELTVGRGLLRLLGLRLLGRGLGVPRTPFDQRAAAAQGAHLGQAGQVRWGALPQDAEISQAVPLHCAQKTGAISES